MLQYRRTRHGCLLQDLEREFRLVPRINDYSQTSTVNPGLRAVVLDPNLCYCTIGNNDDIVRPVFEVRGTPIYLNYRAFRSAL